MFRNIAKLENERLRAELKAVQEDNRRLGEKVFDLDIELRVRKKTDLFLTEMEGEVVGQEQLLFLIGSIEDHDERYRAVVKLIQVQAGLEMDHALEVEISNDVANVRRGRAGALLDLVTMIEQARQRVRAEKK